MVQPRVDYLAQRFDRIRDRIRVYAVKVGLVLFQFGKSVEEVVKEKGNFLFYFSLDVHALLSYFSNVGHHTLVPEVVGESLAPFVQELHQPWWRTLTLKRTDI